MNGRTAGLSSPRWYLAAFDLRYQTNPAVAANPIAPTISATDPRRVRRFLALASEGASAISRLVETDTIAPTNNGKLASAIAATSAAPIFGSYPIAERPRSVITTA